MDTRKLHVTDPVRDCPIDQIELEITPVTLTITGPKNTKKTFSLRLFKPETIDGEFDYLEYFGILLRGLHDQSEGEEREFYRRLIFMLQYHQENHKVDPKRTRIFDIRTLERSTRNHNMGSPKQPRQSTFDEIREMFGMEYSSDFELMRKIMPTVSETVSRLLTDAFYEQPLTSVPLSRKQYEEFRSQTLQEFSGVRADITNLIKAVCRNFRKKLKSDKKLTAQQREQALLKATRLAEDGPDKYWSRVFEHALEREKLFCARFEDIVAEAREIHDQVGHVVDEKGIRELMPDGNELTKEYADCICSHLDIPRVNNLLDRLITRYEEVLQHKDGEFDKAYVPDESEDLQAYEGFICLRQSDDPLDKWYAIGAAHEILVDHRECTRLLLRECDQACHQYIGYAHYEIYRKIRKHLTPWERRAFRVMYCSLPPLGGRVVMQDPVLYSFYDGMDKETQALIWLVLVFKLREWGDEKDLDKKLAQRWKMYLKFYPYWVELMRMDDKEHKRDSRTNTKTSSMHKPVGRVGKSTDQTEITLEGSLADPESTSPTPHQAVVRATPSAIRSLAIKYCKPIDADRLIKYSLEDLSQQQLAAKEGVSQQAISKSIRTGYRAVVKGLEDDGIISSV